MVDEKDNVLPRLQEEDELLAIPVKQGDKADKNASKDIPICSIRLDDIHGKLLLVLYRETRRLLGASADNKLSSEDSAQVIDLLKQITVMKREQSKELSRISDEELEKLEDK